MSDTFTCGNCGGTFPATVSDADCWDEMLDTFPAKDLYGEEIVPVCDPCYQWVMEHIRNEAPELLREEYR